MAQNPGHVEKPSRSRCTLPKHPFIDHGPMLASTVVRGWARRVMSKVHGRTSWVTMGGDAHVFRNIASCGAVLDNLQHEATWTRFFRLGRERTIHSSRHLPLNWRLFWLTVFQELHAFLVLRPSHERLPLYHVGALLEELAVILELSCMISRVTCGSHARTKATGGLSRLGFKWSRGYRVCD